MGSNFCAGPKNVPRPTAAASTARRSSAWSRFCRRGRSIPRAGWRKRASSAVRCRGYILPTRRSAGQKAVDCDCCRGPNTRRTKDQVLGGAAASRKPTPALRRSAGFQKRQVTRKVSMGSRQQPPRSALKGPSETPTLSGLIRSTSTTSSRHHSQTLPARSQCPSKPLPAGYNPTGVGEPTWYLAIPAAKFARSASGSSFPQGYCGSSPQRDIRSPGDAARFHSSSVGRRTSCPPRCSLSHWQ